MLCYSHIGFLAISQTRQDHSTGTLRIWQTFFLEDISSRHFLLHVFLTSHLLSEAYHTALLKLQSLLLAYPICLTLPYSSFPTSDDIFHFLASSTITILCLLLMQYNSSQLSFYIYHIKNYGI